MIAGEFEIGRFVIPYRVVGHSGEPVMVVNGAQQSIASWRSLASHLSHDFRVILYDSPGQGRARIVSGPYKVTLAEQREVIEALLERLGFDRVNMFAASWGAIVGASYAAASSHRVKRLVLASMGCRPNEHLAEMIRNGLALADGVPFDDMGMKAQVGALMLACFGAQLSEGYKQKIVEQFRGMSEAHARCFYEHCVFVAGIHHVSDLIDLSKIEAETLLVIGENDTIVDPDDIHYACSTIPRAQEVLVRNAGHFLHQEPGKEGIIELYAEFFRSGSENIEREADMACLNASELGPLVGA